MDKQSQPESYVENNLNNQVNQDRLVDALLENWESQERGRLVDLPRWAQ